MNGIEQAVALDHENVDAVFELATTYSWENQAGKAMQYFERGRELNPDNSQAHYRLFLLYSRNNRPEKAKVELEVFDRLEETDQTVRRAKRKRRAGRDPAKNGTTASESKRRDSSSCVLCDRLTSIPLRDTPRPRWRMGASLPAGRGPSDLQNTRRLESS